VIGNNERDSLKNTADWAISSRASWEQEEGSTTNAYNPERMMKRQERTTSKEDDIVWARVKIREMV